MKKGFEPAEDDYVVDARGQKKGVIMSLKRYRRLLEDLHDLAIVAERRQEKLISESELKRRLSQHALV